MIGAYILALFATTTPTTQNLPSQPPIQLVEEAHAEEIPIVATSSMSIQGKISYYAEKYDVSSTTMNSIIQCESHGSTTIQSLAHYTRDHPEWGVVKGQRELSWGLVQIHEPAHKDISRAEMFDPDFSLVFLASKMKEGKAKAMWTCYPSYSG